MFSNTFPVGAVLAGPLFGLAQQLGYRLGYVVSSVLCLAGLLLLSDSRRPSRRERRAALTTGPLARPAGGVPTDARPV
jgi:SET family sugar efflux transporter-like MFS transporter